MSLSRDEANEERAGTATEADIGIGMEAVEHTSAAGVMAGDFEGAAGLARLECA